MLQPFNLSMCLYLFQTCACYYPQDVGSETYGPFAVETISIDTAAGDVTVRDFSLTYNKRVNKVIIHDSSVSKDAEFPFLRGKSCFNYISKFYFKI